MELPPFLIDHPDGEIRVTGTRISLYQVVTDYRSGDSAEMLACKYRTLALADAHKVIAFYLENREAVDRYVAEYQSDLDRIYVNGRRVGSDVLRQRMEQTRARHPEKKVG